VGSKLSSFCTGSAISRRSDCWWVISSMVSPYVNNLPLHSAVWQVSNRDSYPNHWCRVLWPWRSGCLHYQILSQLSTRLQLPRNWVRRNKMLAFMGLGSPLFQLCLQMSLGWHVPSVDLPLNFWRSNNSVPCQQRHSALQLVHKQHQAEQEIEITIIYGLRLGVAKAP
jgi:hypothetical protein